jgi:transcriptional regulator with XRE-family HTH domain
MPLRSDIADVLRDARIRQGLSLREVAGKANVSLQTVSRLELRKVQPQASTLFSIARALEVPLDELFQTERAS